jgi:hypothetical protein
MKKTPSFLLILAYLASAEGNISFNKFFLDSTGKYFFTYPVSLPKQAALQELQKNFIKQKFGEGFLDQEPVAILELYKSQNKDVELLSDAVSFPFPGIVQYVTSTYIYYSETSYGQNKFSICIYALANGKKIELNRLFNKGWEKNVIKLIIKEFLLSQNLQSLMDYSYTQKESDFKPENVKISSTGMEFVYPVNQIAPLTVGEQSVFLSWKSLKPYLNRKSIIYPKLQF